MVNGRSIPPEFEVDMWHDQGTFVLQMTKKVPIRSENADHPTPARHP